MSRRLVAWLASIAIALNALWPLLAHAAPRGIATEICSVNAGAVAQSGLFRTDLPPVPFKVTAAHCPFCASWAGTAMPAIAVAWSFLLPLLDAADVKPSTSIPVVSLSFVVLAASPRAPPLS
jgi:hypothetical protein